MIRILIVLAATFGVGVFLSLFFPTLRDTAFHNHYGITWVMVGACAACFAAVKITK